jgi:hypothetical protein
LQAAIPSTLNPAAPSEGNCGEGNRPQPLEVAALLKLAATNVLFSLAIHLAPGDLEATVESIASSSHIRTSAPPSGADGRR